MSGSESARGAQRAWNKAEWRARLRAARRALSPEERRRETELLVEAAGAVAAEYRAATVCCYIPFGTEPGSLQLLDALRAAGVRVLVPVVPEHRAPLLWTAYEGPAGLAEGPLRGLLEPTGERLPPRTIAEASLVITPALAVDTRGVRLGKGAGYYDRTLPLAHPDAELMGVVRDEEFVARLPAEAHDARLTSVLTPRGGPRRL